MIIIIAEKNRFVCIKYSSIGNSIEMKCSVPSDIARMRNCLWTFFWCNAPRTHTQICFTIKTVSCHRRIPHFSSVVLLIFFLIKRTHMHPSFICFVRYFAQNAHHTTGMTERDEKGNKRTARHHTAFQTKVNIVEDSLRIDVLMQNSNHVMSVHTTLQPNGNNSNKCAKLQASQTIYVDMKRFVQFN